MALRGPMCGTELHAWGPDGQILGVQLCRQEMRLSTHGAHGHAAHWFWVCPNRDACGTARLVTPEQAREIAST